MQEKNPVEESSTGCFKYFVRYANKSFASISSARIATNVESLHSFAPMSYRSVLGTNTNRICFVPMLLLKVPKLRVFNIELIFSFVPMSFCIVPKPQNIGFGE